MASPLEKRKVADAVIKAESRSHMHQGGERVGLHLAHHFAPVGLHRDLADTELETHLFIQQARNHQSHVEQIRLVQDNLNTHTPGSFYEVLDPEDAFELGQQFELHYTPKKGSWLNMVEIEFSALSTQCLDRRIADVATLRDEVQAWTKKRNANRTTVNWQFSQTNARSKLERHYQNDKKLI
jgi:hypothetical protein